MAENKKTYTVNSNVTHNGTFYPAGSKVELTSDEHKALQESGLIGDSKVGSEDDASSPGAVKGSEGARGSTASASGAAPLTPQQQADIANNIPNATKNAPKNNSNDPDGKNL